MISVKEAGGPSWDREQVSRHYLTVEARDDLGKGNRNSVQLIVNIEDVNDNAPIFTQGHYEARLMENAPNFEIPLKVEARDADLNGRNILVVAVLQSYITFIFLGTKNSEIEYILFGELEHNFTINSISGVIRPKFPLDFEKIKGPLNEHVRVLHFTVRAKDWGVPSFYTDADLTIYLSDVNDHSPYFEYVFYNKTIPETIQDGTSILQVQHLNAIEETYLMRCFR